MKNDAYFSSKIIRKNLLSMKNLEKNNMLKLRMILGRKQ
jgi:hypothetical protein